MLELFVFLPSRNLSLFSKLTYFTNCIAFITAHSYRYTVSLFQNMYYNRQNSLFENVYQTEYQYRAVF